MPVFEYPPARVKRTVTGRGAADKLQVAQMIRALLRLSELPPADAADALAIAVTHLSASPALTTKAATTAPHAALLAAIAAGKGRKARATR